MEVERSSKEVVVFPFSGMTRLMKEVVLMHKRGSFKEEPQDLFFGNSTPSSSPSPLVTVSTKSSIWRPQVVLPPLILYGFFSLVVHIIDDRQQCLFLLWFFNFFVVIFSLDLVEKDERGCARVFNFFFIFLFVIVYSWYRIWLKKWLWTGL